MLTPFLLIGCLLASQPASNEALKTEVAKLVRNLDADTLKERTEAEKRLIELGPAVLDMLPAPESQPNETLAEAIRRIRKQLQETVAAKSVESSTVTLHGRFKVSKVLAEIQKQTGNTITDLPRAAGAAIPDPEITIQFEKTPFWTALDSVLDQAQLSIYPYGQPGAVQIVPRGPHDLPRTGRADIEGPMRIEPVLVLAKRELRSSSPPTLQVSLEVAWEPRLQPIALKQRMANVTILDSSGGNLAVDDPQAEKEAFPRAGSSAVEMDIALAMPTQPLKEIATLKGSVQAMLLGKVETFRFVVDLLKGKQEKRIAAATVALDEVRKNGDSWEVFVRLRYDSAGDALESHRNWVLQNEAYLEDADGKSIQPDSMETTLRTKNEIGV
ncbi:MAG: hypothetical protein ABSG53_15380, partial [Thermoguttaceae bacterium]